jgi:hypothetical protein
MLWRFTSPHFEQENGMKGFLKGCQLGVILVVSGLAGCGQSNDEQWPDAEPQEDIAQDCNRALLDALPDKVAIAGVAFSHSSCSYNQAMHAWEKGDLYITVQIMDSAAEVPTNIRTLGVGDMLDHANVLTFSMAKFSISAGKESREQLLADPVLLNLMGGETYLPWVTITSTGDDAVANVSKGSGVSPLYAIIDERYVVTIERNDLSEMEDNKDAERAYRPFLNGMHLNKLP